MIYVHVPFCRSFCTYCDFYSERACPTEEYVAGVCREAEARKDEISAAAAVDTLYFGGGTPSVLPPAVLGRIADACGGRSWKEWTVELNPDDISPSYAAELRALGVNRASIGVQSLNDGMLRWMNRRHDAAGARDAFRTLREAGFDNISIDIIFGVGGMSAAMLESSVREILEWRPEHISAYQLSLEEGSALGAMARDGRYSELPEEECAAQYMLICQLLSAAGYEHYEISNWALPGRRALHNSAYWTRAPYVGLGPGAHSLSSADCRSWNSEKLVGWSAESEILSPEEVREEQIMLGLRTADGVHAELCGPHPSLIPSAIPGNLRIPETHWFTADDIISGVAAVAASFIPPDLLEKVS